MAKIPKKPPQGFGSEDRTPGFLRKARDANISTPDRFGSIYEVAGLEEAGARFWYAMDGWSLDESRLLLLGIDPRKVGGLSPEFVNALLWPVCEPEYARMLHRAGQMGTLVFPAKPVDVMAWADGKLPVPGGLRDLRAKASIAALEADDRLPAPVVPPLVTISASAPVPRQRAQEDRIMELLVAQGYDPAALPVRVPGKPGAKAAIKKLALLEPKLFTQKTFDTAWQRVRADGRVAETSR